MNNVKLYLVANDPKALVKAQLENNRKHQTAFKYGDAMFVDGKWFIWFEANVAEYLVYDKTILEEKKVANAKPRR
jgi:hypothetical protein